MDALDGAAVREIRAALALAGVEGLGPARARILIDRCGSARAVIAGSPALPAGLPDRVGRRIRRARPVPRSRIEELSERGIRVLAYGSPGYPPALAHLHDPPVVLFLTGPLRLPGPRAVTIVGTRKATEYGRRMARDLAGGLARAGWCVVSGMARGVDGAAHRGALDAGGRSVGVLGSGLDHEYPASHRRLYGRMRRRGLLVSEFPPEEPPVAGLFPRRNRVLAALSRAVVVVQAGRRSGALITVDHALDLGREVLAVPGPVGPEASVGVHRLLRDGAGLVTSAEDVLEVLGVDGEGEGAASGPPAAAPGGREAALLAPLGEGPRPVEELARAAGLPVVEATARLAVLEVAGRVRALPGGRYELARETPSGRSGV